MDEDISSGEGVWTTLPFQNHQAALKMRTLESGLEFMISKPKVREKYSPLETQVLCVSQTMLIHLSFMIQYHVWKIVAVNLFCFAGSFLVLQTRQRLYALFLKLNVRMVLFLWLVNYLVWNMCALSTYCPL